MNNSNKPRKDTFKYQFKNFKMLLVGSKMAKISSIILITVSFTLAYKSRENIGIVLSLLIGATSLIIYMVRFLSLKNIKQKSYTQTSLVSSIVKFKAYISNRKKYEMIFMSFWVITLIPFVSSIESNITAIIGAVAYIGIVSIFGILAFKKIDKQILALETVMSKELDAFK